MGYKQYCKNPEKIENFEAAKADNFKGWYCHHRLETWNSDGERRLVDVTRKELIALKMYYSRPPEELIFLTSSEHNRLHNKGKPRTEETRKKLSEAHKGKQLTEEHKKKLREAKKNFSAETRRRMSEAHKGHLVSEETRRRMSEARKGMHPSEETRKKLSEANKGKPSNAKGTHFFNNGKINVRAKECPDGFVPGMLK